MKQKDLKIDFRYLTGNIACLSVDSISGESVHNDINNEEAIIIFNSLVGEKADCQTVKSLLKENQELKKQLEAGEEQYNDLVEEKEELQEQLSSNTLQLEKLKKQVNKGLYNTCLPYKTGYNKAIKDKETQQKEFIKYLEDEIERKRLNATCMFEYNDTVLPLKEILQKYKSIIGGNKDEK